MTTLSRVVPGTLPRELRKTEFNATHEYGATTDDLYKPADIDTANIVTSRVVGTDNMHAPAIDIDHPMWLLRVPNTDFYQPVFEVNLSELEEEYLKEAYVNAGITKWDFPISIVPSSTPNHYHLYMDKLMTEEQYQALLYGMTKAGLVEEGYYGVFLSRHMTCLRLPWIKKTEEERRASAERRKQRAAEVAEAIRLAELSLPSSTAIDDDMGMNSAPLPDFITDFMTEEQELSLTQTAEGNANLELALNSTTTDPINISSEELLNVWNTILQDHAFRENFN